MFNNISEEELFKLRITYPPRSKVKLISMNDVHAPKPGTVGRVIIVDDTGTVHISWADGHRLGAVYGEDKIEKYEDLALKNALKEYARLEMILNRKGNKPNINDIIDAASEALIDYIDEIIDETLDSVIEECGDMEARQ